MEDYRIVRIMAAYDEPVDFSASPEQMRQSPLASVGTGMTVFAGAVAAESVLEVFTEDSSCYGCVEQSLTSANETIDEIYIGLAATSIGIVGVSFVLMAGVLRKYKNVQRWTTAQRQDKVLNGVFNERPKVTFNTDNSS